MNGQVWDDDYERKLASAYDRLNFGGHVCTGVRSGVLRRDVFRGRGGRPRGTKALFVRPRGTEALFAAPAGVMVRYEGFMVRYEGFMVRYEGVMVRYEATPAVKITVRAGVRVKTRNRPNPNPNPNPNQSKSQNYEPNMVE